MKKEFFFPSADKKTTIRCAEWIPEGAPKAVLQLCHGMCEYIDRYDDFASYLNKHGFYVAANDHLGHGGSVTDVSKLGFFEEGFQSSAILKDMRTLQEMTGKKYPDLPYFLLGHSMGSFFVRRYISKNGTGLSGALVMGTGYTPFPALAFGLNLCRTIAKKEGEAYRSVAVNNLAFGSYNKKFEPARTSYDWLTKDEKIVDAYSADPLCAYIFTVNGYYGLFRSIRYAQKDTPEIPKELPVLLVSGAEDPVGGFGKGVKKVYEDMKKAGIRDLTMKLYPEDRHEILNETDRQQVYEDLRNWMEQRF